MINASLSILIAHAAIFAYNNGVPFRITSYKEDDGRPLERIFNTHKQGRAVDISVRHWKQSTIIKLCDDINKKYKDIAAISYYTRRPMACVHHKTKNGAIHMHLQVKE